MIVYRLAKSKYCHDLSGSGARKTGGRWNSKGIPIVYTSDSRALCTVEIAVHMPLSILPIDFKLVTIDIPDSIEIAEMNVRILPDGWSSIPYIGATQKLGDKFVKKRKYAVIRVPSAVVSGDFNILINPQHADFSKIQVIKIENFSFDKRLFSK